MDIKVLYVVAVVVMSITGGYYYYSGSAEKLQTENQSMTYAAKGIVLTQSDKQGKLYLRANVDEIKQNVKTQTSDMHNLKAVMYKNGQVDTSFSAGSGQGLNDNSRIILKGNVVASKQSIQGQTIIKTDQLYGYLATRIIETKSPVTIIYPRSQFVSQGLKANLDTGQYEFFNIRGKYAPKS